MAGYPDVSGAMPFTTVGSDWLLFDFYGYWNSTSNEMTFFIRRGATLEKGRQVPPRRRQASVLGRPRKLPTWTRSVLGIEYYYVLTQHISIYREGVSAFYAV